MDWAVFGLYWSFVLFVVLTFVFSGDWWRGKVGGFLYGLIGRNSPCRQCDRWGAMFNKYSGKFIYKCEHCNGHGYVKKERE